MAELKIQFEQGTIIFNLPDEISVQDFAARIDSIAQIANFIAKRQQRIEMFGEEVSDKQTKNTGKKYRWIRKPSKMTPEFLQKIEQMRKTMGDKEASIALGHKQNYISNLVCLGKLPSRLRKHKCEKKTVLKNFSRESFSPELIAKIQKMRQTMTDEQISKAFGKQQAWLSNYIKQGIVPSRFGSIAKLRAKNLRITPEIIEKIKKMRETMSDSKIAQEFGKSENWVLSMRSRGYDLKKRSEVQ